MYNLYRNVQNIEREGSQGTSIGLREVEQFAGLSVAERKFSGSAERNTNLQNQICSRV